MSEPASKTTELLHNLGQLIGEQAGRSDTDPVLEVKVREAGANTVLKELIGAVDGASGRKSMRG